MLNNQMYKLYIQHSCKYCKVIEKAIVELKADDQFEVLDASSHNISQTPTLKMPSGEIIHGRTLFQWFLDSSNAYQDQNVESQNVVDSRPTIPTDNNDDVQAKFEELRANFAA
jgi:hypothetical protein